ncbi:ester cyclase [Klebsiella pneumoniae subsp. pneumoniae]|uniref:ester cyclase n=1 Tax=Klebsiella pneumoniae TaxID=573 RepID=UPI0021B18AFE|nr:ester cyclase [Klebsiella pneumoniae]MCT6795168.1 ester cyclase [Klebsiella pneumoniae subsp. pneumoniae]
MTSFTQDNNTALVIEFYEAFSRRDLDAFDNILAPEWINHPADPGHENTPQGFKGGVQDFHRAFENFSITRDAIVAQDNLVVCRITMTGRHVQPLGEWQPSGAPTTLYGMDMHRLVNGRIVETWHFERMAKE